MVDGEGENAFEAEKKQFQNRNVLNKKKKENILVCLKIGPSQKWWRPSRQPNGNQNTTTTTTKTTTTTTTTTKRNAIPRRGLFLFSVPKSFRCSPFFFSSSRFVLPTALKYRNDALNIELASRLTWGRFGRVLPSFTEFYLVLPSFTEFLLLERKRRRRTREPTRLISIEWEFV